MRILGMMDRVRKAEKSNTKLWYRVDEKIPGKNDIIVAIANDGTAACGSYGSHYIYRLGQKRIAITMYDRWSLLRPRGGDPLWRRFSERPAEGQKIIAVSAVFNRYAVGSYGDNRLYCWDATQPIETYEFWENYPNVENICEY